MTNIIKFSKKTSYEWPIKLAHAWPTLLTFLLDQEHGESLERLQLISIDLRLGADLIIKPPVGVTTLNRTRVGSDNFLALHSVLAVSSVLNVAIMVNYFVRGSRKYFKNTHSSLPATLACDPIEMPGAQEFFANNGQENSIFYDKELAHLNGRLDILVPTQLTLHWLLERCLKLWPEHKAQLTTFHLDFYRSFLMGQELKLAHEISDALTLALYVGEDVAIVLKASI